MLTVLYAAATETTINNTSFHRVCCSKTRDAGRAAYGILLAMGKIIKINIKNCSVLSYEKL